MGLENETMSSMITVEQAAERLQVKPNTIRTWIKEGRIPGRKIGRVYRIPEQALDKLTSEAEAPQAQSKRLDALSLLGKYRQPGGRSLDDYLREKHEEIDEEERRWEEAHRKPDHRKGEAA